MSGPTGSAGLSRASTGILPASGCSSLPVPEIFRIRVGIPQRVGDEHSRLTSQLETLAALVASDQVIQAHHVRSSLGKFPAVFVTGAARQFLLFPADFPTHGKFKFAAATRAKQLNLPGFFALGVKSSLVHN